MSLTRNTGAIELTKKRGHKIVQKCGVVNFYDPAFFDNFMTPHFWAITLNHNAVKHTRQERRSFQIDDIQSLRIINLQGHRP